MVYGRSLSDIGMAVDVERLRRERIEKAKNSAKKFNLECLLCFRPENIRYLTIGPHYAFYRYVFFPIKDQPTLFDAGMTEWAYRISFRWLKTKHSIPMPEGLIFNEQAYNRQIEKFVQQIKAELKEYSLSKEPIGIDVYHPAIIRAMEKEGINLSTNGAKVMVDARKTKTKDEIELLRIAHSIVEGCFEEAKMVIKPGVTERQVWAAIVRKAFDLGAEAVYGGLVCSGPHTWPNANVITDRIIRPGDIVFIDIYDLSYFGYRTCYYRTFCCGKPTQKQEEAWARVRDWLWDSIKIIKPGITTKDIVEKWPKAEEFGYPSEEASCLAQWGHGIGLTLYEPPMISRIWSLDYPEKIEEGMVIALETIGPTGEKTPEYPYGQGVRIEEVIAITESGYDLLTRWPVDKITACEF